MKANKNILITGAAGFIGYHLCKKMIGMGYTVYGLDNINDYYNSNLKYDRLHELGIKKEKAKKFNLISSSTLYTDKFFFIRADLQNYEVLSELFEKYSFNLVCNLAAQAGVRYSLKNARAYTNSNLDGFINILECCRHFKIKKLVYASSSSVYGNSDKVPFNENLNVDKPISLYAATKKANELMAYTYSHLYSLKTIGVRFFTVYGPWGRPDMAIYLFADAITKGESIKVFNHGNLERDFTYIDDIVLGLYNIIKKSSNEESAYEIYNIGNNKSIKLMNFISLIEKELGIKAKKDYLPMQKGDVNKTWADVNKLIKNYNYSPDTDIEVGIKKFIYWYKKYNERDI